MATIQEISADELIKGLSGTWKGQPGIEYVERVPPYRTFNWDGSRLVNDGTPVVLTSAQIASPTAEILADTSATYIGPDGARLYSNGSSLIRIGAAVAYKASGTSAAYVSSFDGAGVAGVFGLPERMAIPANTLVAGTSQIRVVVQIGKVGTGTAFFAIHFGPLDSTADENLFTSSAPQFTAVNPSEWFMEVLISFSAGRCHTAWRGNSLNVGSIQGFPTEDTGLDFAVVNYLNFAISGAAAASTYNLISYSVEVVK